MKHGAFFAKLRELEHDQQRIQACLQACQTQDTEQLHRELQKTKQTYDKTNRRLETYIKGSRCQAVSDLAEAQQTYYHTVKQLTEQQIPAYFHNPSSTPDEEQTETMLLYAEYAIDFARQSMYHALITALLVMEKQSGTEREDRP